MVTWRYAAIGALLDTSGDYDWSGETLSEWRGVRPGFNSLASQIPDNTISGNNHSVSGASHSPHWRREALILRVLGSRRTGGCQFGGI